MDEMATTLAYGSPGDMLFGVARRPVVSGRGVEIGNGAVLPEVNFTLPPMLLEEATLLKAREVFRETVSQILQRAVALRQPALVLEFEQLYELTLNPEWGALITGDIRQLMDTFQEQHGLKTALRVTVADIREQERPPRMRTGEHIRTMLRAFELCAEAGADILAIESTGGKEVSDRALLEADMDGIAYALGVLAPNDMAFLWDGIVEIAKRYGRTPGGDTACGFGNTAMQLAHQGMLPRVLAATVRLMTAPRSLMAVRHGATGPLKDCGYENPILKAITGVPIAMEGKSSACAHSSPLGNIAGATADLWSNESVQHVRLLGGFAPEVFTEVLIYDCRLMNAALAQNAGPLVRDLLVRSDEDLDPQALVLSPDVVYEAGRRIVDAGPDAYRQTVAMARLAMEVLRDASRAGRLALPKRELRWLSTLEAAVESLPETGELLAARLAPAYRELYLPAEYGIG